MSIIDLVRAEQAATTASTAKADSAKPERAKTQFWANVGMNLEGANEDGSDLFISLPLGIPLDDLKPQKVTGNNTKWRNLVEAKNQLLAVILKEAGKLEPGQRISIPGFTVEIARVGEAVEPTSDGDNPLLAAMFAQLSGK